MKLIILTMACWWTAMTCTMKFDATKPVSRETIYLILNRTNFLSSSHLNPTFKEKAVGFLTEFFKEAHTAIKKGGEEGRKARKKVAKIGELASGGDIGELQKMTLKILQKKYREWYDQSKKDELRKKSTATEITPLIERNSALPQRRCIGCCHFQ